MTLKSENELQRAILNYWFGELKEYEAPAADFYKMWFAKNEDIDLHIRNSFEEELKNAAEGKLKVWEETPKGILALIILLDQFSRNIYRGTPKSFMQDPLALELCLGGIDKGFDERLHPVERLFFYMPLEHSEDLSIQKRSVEQFSLLEKTFISPPSLASMVRSFRDYAEKHLVIIERFGRFPHRNAVLGRRSTSEEVEFLKQPGSSF